MVASDTVTILCVDDEARNRKFLEIMLLSNGYNVIKAASGPEALNIIGREKVDLVILDIMMPGMDGFEVCQKIKSDEQHLNLPVIIITALNSTEDRVRGIEAGAEEFISKPFEQTEVLARIKMLLRVKELHDELAQAKDNLEQQVHSRTRELEKAYESLQASQEKLLHQEKLATIGHLAAGVVHEIKNPTAYIGANLSTLSEYIENITEFINLQDRKLRETHPEKDAEVKKAREELDIDFLLEDLPEMISESLDGVDKIKDIVSGLKSFARKEKDSSELADLNRCLEDALKVSWNELKYNAVVEKNFGDIPLIDCFPNQLVQVFINLFVNAAHAIEGQGTISVSTTHENGIITVRISDTGCGIPESARERIFEPFFTTKEEGEGTGLGLSIVKDIVSRHHGTIGIDSLEGRGTTFTVQIPVDQGD